MKKKSQLEAAAQGQAQRAGRLFGPADQLLPATSIFRDNLNKHLTAAREQLDATTFKAGWTIGQTMTLEQAITDALQDDDELFASLLFMIHMESSLHPTRNCRSWRTNSVRDGKSWL